MNEVNNIPALEQAFTKATDPKLKLALGLLRATYLLGSPLSHVANVFQVRGDTARKWLRHWNEGGIEELSIYTEEFKDHEFEEWLKFSSKLDHPACWIRKTYMALKEEGKYPPLKLRFVLPFFRLITVLSREELATFFLLSLQECDEWVIMGMTQFKKLCYTTDGTSKIPPPPTASKEEKYYYAQIQKKMA